MAEKTVEQRCYEALKARGVTFAAAESCTGGLIAKRITDVQLFRRACNGFETVV
mgnify:CR=1 FL=1